MLVPGKLFQPSLVFVGKAGAYPSEAPLYFRLLALLANFRLGWKNRDERSSLLRTLVNYDRKKFYSFFLSLFGKFSFICELVKNVELTEKKNKRFKWNSGAVTFREMTLDRTAFSGNILRKNDDRMTFCKMSLQWTMLSRNKGNDSIITVSQMTISVMFSRNI